VGLGAVFGHSLSPFLGFKGGKGIATGLGAMLGRVTLVGLGSFAIFTLFMALTMTVSLSSIAGAASLPIWGFVFAETWPIRIVLLVMGGYIIFRHRANIDRIRQGVEPKYGQKAPDEPAPGPIPRAICLLIAIGIGVGIYFSHFHNPESAPESAQTSADVPANLNV
ncbi:MAG: glycerol-3-phosphate acyltransferase, partial [Verrucomicrobiales bacterium]